MVVDFLYGISTTFVLIKLYKMKIEKIFTNFVAYEDVIVDNDAIEKFCYKKMCEDKKGRIISNNGGWQSSDLYLPFDELNDLGSIINYNFRKISKKMSLKNVHKLNLKNFWININKNSNTNIPHTHRGSVLSAIYYVKVPPESGCLKFLTSVIYDDHLKEYMIDKYTKYNSSTYRFVPNQGKLIIFPSWLIHEVEPNNTNFDRISIAFNAGYDE